MGEVIYLDSVMTGIVTPSSCCRLTPPLESWLECWQAGADLSLEKASKVDHLVNIFGDIILIPFARRRSSLRIYQS
jgi:hypothetical protein